MPDKSIIEGAAELENGVSKQEQDPAVEAAAEKQTSGISLNLEWLKTPTGDGAIEDYIDHPLNFFKSKGFAQILRGATGFFGNLRLAVLDVVLGILQFLKERKAGANAGDIGKQA